MVSDYKFRKDFQFLVQLFSEFFSEDPKGNKSFLEKFKIIGENTSGWENWFQLELFCFLKQKQLKNELKDVLRETPYDLDKRSKRAKETNFHTCAIDIEIQRKKTNEWIPLEIKQARYFKTCIKNMLKDLKKYNSITERDKQFGRFRTPFFLGIFQNYKENNLKSIESKLIKIEFEYKYKLFEIKGTNFTAILF